MAENNAQAATPDNSRRDNNGQNRGSYNRNNRNRNRNRNRNNQNRDGARPEKSEKTENRGNRENNDNRNNRNRNYDDNRNGQKRDGRKNDQNRKTHRRPIDNPKPIKPAEETLADIKADNDRIEKEIWIEIAEIHTIKLE